MKLFTSYYGANVKNAPGLISISRTMPSGWNIPRLTSVVPGPWFQDVDYDAYENLYGRVLAPLRAHEIYQEIEELAEGAPVVKLLCHEPLHFRSKKRGEFCHRIILGSWLEGELGIAVPEWNRIVAAAPEATTKIFAQEFHQLSWI